MNRANATTVLELVGFGSITLGVGLVSPPGAFIVGGVFAVVTGYFLGK